MASLHINNFVLRQTRDSEFSHWEISNNALLDLVQKNMPNATQGYRDGVLIVPVAPEGFYSGIVQLKAGDKLAGEFKSRKEGEIPRKSHWVVGGQKLPARRVDVILYRHDVLAENNENDTDCDYEIISVNASPVNEEIPIPVGALIANHFQLSGGTATNMSDEEFVALLRKSVNFWHDKSHAEPKVKT